MSHILANYLQYNFKIKNIIICILHLKTFITILLILIIFERNTF